MTIDNAVPNSINSPDSNSLQRLLQIMAMLRHREFGCPWDLKQSLKSLIPYTIEEVYEVVDAIEREDMADLEDELGDLLFQVVFYSQLANEEGRFSFADVATGIADKLLRRHPHVFPGGRMEAFGTVQDLSPDEVVVNWEAIKQRERIAKRKKREQAEKLKQGEAQDKGASPDGEVQGKEAIQDKGEVQDKEAIPEAAEHDEQAQQLSLLDSVPRAVPALERARKLQKAASRAGFDWQDTPPVLAKLIEEVAELEAAIASRDRVEIEAEFGDVLFTLVNLGRHLDTDSETALRSASRRFETRFRWIESSLNQQGKSLAESSLEELESLWQQAKQQE